MPVLGKACQCLLNRVTQTSRQEAPVHLFPVYTSILMIDVTPRYMSVLINIRALAHACAWESMVSVN